MKTLILVLAMTFTSIALANDPWTKCEKNKDWCCKYEGRCPEPIIVPDATIFETFSNWFKSLVE